MRLRFVSAWCGTAALAVLAALAVSGPPAAGAPVKVIPACAALITRTDFHDWLEVPTSVQPSTRIQEMDRSNGG